MSDEYFNREQTAAKHDILRRYLEPFAYKVLPTFGSLDFIDGFSGPWQERDVENLTDTSIGISLHILQSVAEKLGHTATNRKIRCIFNELSPASYGKLSKFVVRSSIKFPLVKIETLQGEFAANAPKISKIADHAFQFLFIDPTGFTGYPEEVLAFFSGRNCEIIINFMHSFVARFCTGTHKDSVRYLECIVGKSRATELVARSLSADDVEAVLREILQSELKFRFTASAPIYHPDRDTVHFKLIYATNSPAGMEVLRQADGRALGRHDQQRINKRLPPGQGTLFDDLPGEGPYLRMKRIHLEALQDQILHRLNDGRALKFKNLCALIQQDAFVVQSEIKKRVVDLSSRGLVQATWTERNPKARGPSEDDRIFLATK